MDHEPLDDESLDSMRTEPKYRVSATKVRGKGAHLEQQFECLSDDSETRKYRVYRRWNPSKRDVFSVGLLLCRPGDDLVLCRYNGGWHQHFNVIEREMLAATPHIHLTTQRYLAKGRRGHTFAMETQSFYDAETALICLVRDCRIRGILPEDDPNTPDLFWR